MPRQLFIFISGSRLDFVSRDPYLLSRDPDLISRDPDVITRDPDLQSRDTHLVSRDPELISRDADFVHRDPDFVSRSRLIKSRSRSRCVASESGLCKSGSRDKKITLVALMGHRTKTMNQPEWLHWTRCVALRRCAAYGVNDLLFAGVGPVF